MRHLSFILVALLIVSCKKDEGPQQLPPQKIPVVKAEQSDVPIYEELVGQIYGLKDIPIRARVDGFLEKISFDEGTRVTRGQLLYSIDPDPFLAQVAAQQSTVAQMQTMKVNAKNELERYKPLAEINAVSQSDLDAAQATYDASIASEEAARANLEQANIRLSYTEIRSPIEGLIGKTEAREGEYVGKEPNPVILNTVSRIDTVRVQFSISEAKYLELAREFRKNKTAEQISKEVKEGKVKPFVELILADGSIYEEKGGIDFVDAQINASTGSLLIQASFPNSSLILRPGLYAKVRLQLGIAKDAIVLPQRCLIELQGQYSVMLVGPDNKVVSAPVTLGPKMGDMVIISKGLKDGDQVVIDAIQKVRPEMEVVPVASEFKSKTAE
ncbi:efflux RND transporter periplasmic adaptor subunit [Winogradskyella aurantiaca]|uniref:efflux RND transporter periplasmic adaptor subunit n=1 Tax=Winogradskyella aurantiaca TaxID=2219558 RepID=UPI000E1E01C7|nr:efflux RND transporter periplasmic adaptor subunit [Winogradskyella aurantiaca]